MAKIVNKVHGLQLVDTISKGRRIYLHMGDLNKTEQKEWLRSYDLTVSGLTHAQRETVSSVDLKEMVSKMMLLEKPAQIEQAVRGLAIQTAKDPGAVTRWADLIPEFLAWQKVALECGPAQQSHREAFMEIIKTFLKEENIEYYNDLDSDQTAKFIQWRKTYRRDTDHRHVEGREVSASALRHEIQAWKKMVDWAISKKKFHDHKPFFGIRILTTVTNTATISPLSISEVEKLFKQIRDLGNEKFHDLALLAYLTGCEIMAMQFIVDNHPNCIDKQTGMLRVFARQVSGKSGGKTDNRGRELEITPTVKAVLDRGNILGKYKIHNFIANVFKRNWNLEQNDNDGKKIKRMEWHFHQLRHSFASHHLSAGVPLEVISNACGHADITTTRNVYGKFLPVKGKKGVQGMIDAHKEHLAAFNESYFTSPPKSKGKSSN
jgi:integrase